MVEEQVDTSHCNRINRSRDTVVACWEGEGWLERKRSGGTNKRSAAAWPLKEDRKRKRERERDSASSFKEETTTSRRTEEKKKKKKKQARGEEGEQRRNSSFEKGTS